MEEIELHFDYQPGTTTSPDTLYAIHISVVAEEGSDQESSEDSLDTEDIDDADLFEEEDEEAETED